MTSIEWLDEKLQDTMFIQYGYSDGVRKIVIPLEDYMRLKQEAKEMHKAELERNYFIGLLHPKIIKDPAEVIEEKISDLEIINEAIEHSNLYTNKFTPRNAFIQGAKWYREQLKQN
jgi:hypothetical protein